MFHVNLPTDILKAALAFAPQKDIRHYLNGVRVERAGRVFNIVATDGVTLFCAKYSEQFSDDMQEDFVIPFDAVKKALTGNKAQSITLQGDRYQGGYVLGDVSFVPDTTTYPQWRNALPSDKCIDDGHRTVAYLNPELLAKCTKAFKALGGKPEFLQVEQFGEHGPSMVLFGERDDCFAVVMPMRKTPIERDALKDLRDSVTVSQAQAAKAA
jgi:hypothetical protein